MKKALLIIALLLIPLWSGAEIYKAKTDDGKSAVTETQKDRSPSSTKKSSKDLPCHAESKLDRAKSLSKMDTVRNDCIDDDAIKRNLPDGPYNPNPLSNGPI